MCDIDLIFIYCEMFDCAFTGRVFQHGRGLRPEWQRQLDDQVQDPETREKPQEGGEEVQGWGTEETERGGGSTYFSVYVM